MLLIAPAVIAAEPTPSGGTLPAGNCTPCTNPMLIHVPPDPYMVATLVIVSLTLGIIVGWFARSIGKSSPV